MITVENESEVYFKGVKVADICVKVWPTLRASFIEAIERDIDSEVEQRVLEERRDDYLHKSRKEELFEALLKIKRVIEQVE